MMNVSQLVKPSEAEQCLMLSKAAVCIFCREAELKVVGGALSWAVLPESAAVKMSAPAVLGDGGLADDLQRWRARWEAVGVVTIPVVPNDKAPFLASLGKSWLDVSPEEQWEMAAQTPNCNIATLAAPGREVFDCDDQRATAVVEGTLRGLGIPLISEETPRGGRHIRIRLADPPNGIATLQLAPRYGKGDLRLCRAYVVAPCSQINGRLYTMVSGQPEDLLALPAIRWQDIAWLLASANPTDKAITEPPIKLLWRPLPSYVKRMLADLRDAPKGQPIARMARREPYPTRSEAEAGIISILILHGWSFEDVQALFEKTQPGHYAEHADKDAYLRTTYQNCLNHIAEVPERQEIASLYHLVAQSPAPGSTGAIDQRVLLGVLSLAYQYASSS